MIQIQTIQSCRWQPYHQYYFALFPQLVDFIVLVYSKVSRIWFRSIISSVIRCINVKDGPVRRQMQLLQSDPMAIIVSSNESAMDYPKDL